MARAYGTQTAPAKQAALAEPRETSDSQPQTAKTQPTVKKKLWYCKQCGYVVYREDPPYVCPICKAKKEMFAEIESTVEFKG